MTNAEKLIHIAFSGKPPLLSLDGPAGAFEVG